MTLTNSEFNNLKRALRKSENAPLTIINMRKLIKQALPEDFDELRDAVKDHRIPVEIKYVSPGPLNLPVYYEDPVSRECFRFHTIKAAAIHCNRYFEAVSPEGNRIVEI
jgi:hypothetical protein